jgi:hypothetical protein
MQKLAAKTASLLIMKSVAQNCVAADQDIGSENCFVADHEIGSEN